LINKAHHRTQIPVPEDAVETDDVSESYFFIALEFCLQRS